MDTKKKVVSIVLASSLGIPGAVGFAAQTFSDEMAIEGAMGSIPLTVNLEEAFFGEGGCYQGQKPEEPIIINSISFITKADTTQLPEYKDYLVQGILYYTKEGVPEQRIFRDRVGTDSIEYSLVSRKEDVSAKFNLEAKANSFSFGLIRYDRYIEFDYLSSGEQCLYTLAMMMCITEKSSSRLNLILVDDLLDHLDKTNAETLFESLSKVEGIQFILAGVQECRIGEICIQI